MQKARWPSVMPVSVQPFGKPCSWSSSSGTSRRYRPSDACTMCFAREADLPPSLVRIVRAGASSGSGNAMAPSEYRYEKPVALLTRGSHSAPLR